MKEFNRTIIKLISNSNPQLISNPKLIYNPNLEAEAKILKELRWYKESKKIKALHSTSTVWDNKTPLIAAISLGYFEVVKYLVDDMGVNPHESIKGNCFNRDFVCNTMALDMAIFLERKNIALYLIQKMNQFTRSDRDKKICIPLRLANYIDDLEVFEAILSRDPTLLNTVTSRGLSLLHFSAQLPGVKILEFLLQPGLDSNPRNNPLACDASGATPFVYALNSLNAQGLKILLANGANAVNFEILGNKKSTLQFIVSNNNFPGKSKTPCINVLLAAGAGLNKSRIPPEIYSLFRITKQTQEKIEFLLIAKNEGQNKLLTSVKQVETLINNPQWHFETDLIARTILEPCIQESQLAVALSKLFPYTQMISSSENLNFSADDYFKNQLVKNKVQIPGLHILAFERDVSHCLCLLETKEKNLFDSLENASLIIEEYNEILSFMFEYFAHPKWFEVKVNQDRLKLSEMLVEKISNLFDCLQQIEDVDCTEVLQKLGSYIASLLKNKKELLEDEKLANLCLSMMIINQKIANVLSLYYLENNDETLALNLVLKSMRVDNAVPQVTQKEMAEYLKSNLDRSFIAITIYLNNGWHQKAYDTLLQTIANNSSSCIDIERLTTMKDCLQKQQSLSESFHFIRLILKEYKMEDDGSLQQGEILKWNEDMYDLATKSQQAYKLKTLPYLIEKLEKIADVKQNDEQENLCVTINVLNQTAIYTLKRFAKYNTDVEICLERNEIILTENFILSIDVKERLNKLVDIIRRNCITSNLTSPSTQSITQQIAELSIHPESDTNTEQTKKEKKKTHKTPDFTKIIQEENQDTSLQEFNYGFTQRHGYSPAIPIDSPAIPDDTLFITIPLNSQQFTPFLKLIREEVTGQYHSIASIAPKGFNQQGVKLSSIVIADGNGQPKRVPIARLKILGSEGNGKLRAIGYVNETNVASDSRKRKLYVISDVIDKKEEQRKGYKL